MILSIIIPVYNVEKYVEKCLRSCANQNLKTGEYEIIVVNDGSLDNSLNIVNEVAKDYSNIRVISKANGGLSSARNTGIEAAEGDYLFFVDSDDWIAKDSLSKIVNKLKNESPDCLAICSIKYFGDKAIRRNEYKDETPTTGVEYLKRGIRTAAQFSIYKKLFLDENKLRFWEGMLHEDVEFTTRVHYLAKKVSYLNDIVYFTIQNPQSISHTPNPKRGKDIISIACRHNHDFISNVKSEDQYLFDARIAMDLNSAMAWSVNLTWPQKNEFNQLVYDNRDLFIHLKRAKKTKYRIEYYILILFPHKALSVYKFVQLFNKKHIQH